MKKSLTLLCGIIFLSTLTFAYNIPITVNNYFHQDVKILAGSNFYYDNASGGQTHIDITPTTLTKRTSAVIATYDANDYAKQQAFPKPNGQLTLIVDVAGKNYTLVMSGIKWGLHNAAYGEDYVNLVNKNLFFKHAVYGSDYDFNSIDLSF